MSKNHIQKKARLFILVFLAVCGIVSSEITVIKNIASGRNFIIDLKGDFYTYHDNYSVAKYTPEGGTLIFVAGRIGEGPGDIKRIGWYNISPKDHLLYVTELGDGNRRITRFSSTTGKYVDLWPVELDWKKTDAVSFINFDQTGNAYLQIENEAWTRHKSFQIGSIEKTIVKYSPSGKKIADLYRFQAPFMAQQSGKGNITIPFADYLYWTISNDYLIVRESCKNLISIFDLNGKLVKTIKIPFKREKLTDTDLDKWEQHLKEDPSLKQVIQDGRFDLKFWRKNLPFPEYKVISGYPLYGDEKGNIYSAAATPQKPNTITWAKINMNSGNTTLLHIPTKYRLIGIKNGYFYLELVEPEENVDGDIDFQIFKVSPDSLGQL